MLSNINIERAAPARRPLVPEPNPVPRRGPEQSGLSRREIRQIVLDILG